MKTHDFAKQLLVMAKVLRSSPNVELEDMSVSSLFQAPSQNTGVNSEDIPHALSILVGLNNVLKQQWLDLIEEYEFPIEIRARDGNRDIYGKLLKYLSDNPHARARLTARKGKQTAGVSNELADALTLLLR